MSSNPFEESPFDAGFPDLDAGNQPAQDSLSFGDSTATEESASDSKSTGKKDKEEKKKGPGFNVYGTMQLVGFIAICIACGLLYLEMKRYNFNSTPNITIPTTPPPIAPAG